MQIRRFALYALQVTAVVFFIAAPFIKTANGHSLIRFDIGTLSFYFFNTIISFDHFFNVSLFIMMSVFLFIITAQVFGRIWCGWLCPQSILSDIVVTLSHKFKSMKLRKTAEIFFSAIVSFIFALLCLFYFISPYNLPEFLKSGGAQTGLTIFTVLFVFSFLDYAFVRYKWCKYICPYSKMQSVMSDEDTLYIGMLKGEESNCIKCLACVKACPVGIDARINPQNDCLYCEKCINSCRHVLSKRGKKPVLGYEWGETGRFTLRANLMITCAIFLLLSGIFFYNIFQNKPLYITVLSTARVSENTITVKTLVTNREPLAADISFSVLPEGAATISPNLVSFGFRGEKEATLTINIKENVPLVLKAVTDKGFERTANIEETGSR